MASTIQVDTIKDIGGNTMLESNGSGTITGLPASAVSSGTIATARLGSGTASSSTFLRGDQTYATAGQDNVPAFHAYRPDSYLAIANDTYTTVSVSNELFDVGSAFNTSNYRFTPQVAGKYFLYANVVWDGNINSQAGILIQKNQQFNSTDMRRNFNYATASSGVHVTGMFTANGSSDYFEYRLYQNSGSSVNIMNQGSENYFGGFLVTTS